MTGPVVSIVDPSITQAATDVASAAVDVMEEVGGRFLDTVTGIKVDDPTGLEQSRYDFTYRVFPEDLAMQDNSHYMIININVPTDRGGNSRSNYFPGTVLRNEFSKVDNLRFNTAFGSSPFGKSPIGGLLPTNGAREALSLPRNTRRIAESIALHMPNGGLVYTEDNTYESASLTSMAGSIVQAAGRAVGAGAVTGAVTSAISGGSRLVGYPVNPRIEVLFATRPQRQWMFEVFLAPRSVNETIAVREIIRTLRYHAAPEITGGGFFFIPPAEFDITFFRQGSENRSLPRINTCVLEKIDIDYAPQGGIYSTFRDGSPVAIRLSMGFREIEILHRRRIIQGF